jgi:S1-C subfamily serine protease
MSQRIVSIATLLLVLAPAGPAALAQATKDKPLATKEIYQRTLRATTWILPFEEEGNARVVRSSGSGSLIDATNRLILTNYHVVREKTAAMVFFPSFKDGKPVPERDFYRNNFKAGGGIEGKVVATDKKHDLALIQLPTLPQGVRALKLAADSVGPGDSVHSIGNPGASGALWAYTPGSVKAVYQKKYRSRGRDDVEPLEIDAKVVETTSPVNPGDSGGPLVNERGELVGVTQGGIFDVDARGISFFIDIGEVKALLKSKKLKFTSAPAVVSKPTPGGDDEPATAASAKEARPAVTASDKSEQEAARLLNGAKLFVGTNKTKAVERLEALVKQYPATAAAAEAKKLLAELK